MTAFVLGALVFLAAAWASVGGLTLLSLAQCGGEARPFLGSGRQLFAVHGCLARDAGPLIDIKKRLRIYNPAWMPVIK